MMNDARMLNSDSRQKAEKKASTRVAMREQWGVKRVVHWAPMKESQSEAALVFQKANRSVGRD